MKEILYDFVGYNEKIFYYINHHSNYGNLPVVLKYISHIFDIENIAIYYFIALIYGYYQIFNSKDTEKKRRFSSYYDFMIKFGIGYACFGISYAIFKFTFNMPRPFCSLLNESFSTILDISKERCLSSFPSSHTGLSVLITLFIWNYIKPFWQGVCVFIIFTVGISRIALAMHFPSDILYSLFIAYIIYAISIRLYKLFENNIIKYVKDIIEKNVI